MVCITTLNPTPRTVGRLTQRSVIPRKSRKLNQNRKHGQWPRLIRLTKKTGGQKSCLTVPLKVQCHKKGMTVFFSFMVLLEIQTITANCFYIFPILHQREQFLVTPLLHKFCVTD